jgi:N-acetylglucosamine-6-phosphate deacetylase
MIIKNANIFRENGAFEPGDIYISKERIISAPLKQDEYQDEIILEAEDLYAIPGLTDIHFHGCAGYDFCDGTQEAFKAIASYEAAYGITTICPATMTLPEETLAEICKNAATFQNDQGAILCGIHMEGPFLSVKKKGAQNEAFLHKPDIALYHRLNGLSGYLFKIVSIAPEEEGAMEFIAKLKDSVVISLAHTTAGYDIAMEAFQKGASHATHLYNAMPAFHHRDPGVIGAAFDSRNSHVELICDGIHLHPTVVRATVQMFGEDRIVFVSDSMMATGLPDGIYALGGQEVQVTGKKAVLTGDGAIAGSATNLMDCMKNAVLHMGIPLETAIKAAAVNPAKIIGIYNDFGSITPGKYANIVLLDKELNIKAVILKGEQI